VFDASGRKVRSLVSGQQSAGEHSVRWNGLDHEGRRVANGVYFVRLATLGRVMTSRLIAMQ